MNRLSAGCSGGREDRVLIEITLRHGRRPDEHGLVREANMAGRGVGFRVNRHTGDAALAQNGGDPAGDFAPIGDENLAKAGHGRAC